MSDQRKKKASLSGSASRFLQMLHHLGWSLGNLREQEPLPLGRGTGGRAVWQTVSLPDGSYLLLVFLNEPLPSLEDAFKAYEDLTPLHAELREALRQRQVLSRHLLIVDPQLSAQLMDLPREDILIDARGEGEITDRLLPLLHLNKLAGGSLTGFPRKSLGQRARELNDWTRLWSSRIGASIDGTRPAVTGFFHWLHLARLAEHLELGGRTKRPFADVAQPGSRKPTARMLGRILDPLCEGWNLLQGHSLDFQMRIAQSAQDSGELEPCLRSFSLLSGSKFSAEVFAEAFADEELRQTGWRRSLTDEPETAGDPVRWLSGTATLNLDEMGFPMVLRRFDRIVEDLRRLAREQAVLQERGVRPGLQLDFFGLEPPPLVEEDIPRTVLQLIVQVETSRRERAELARLVLLAHTAQWLARLGRGEPVFPVPQIVCDEGGVAMVPRSGAVPRNPQHN